MPCLSRSSNCSDFTAQIKIPTATQTKAIAMGMRIYRLSKPLLSLQLFNEVFLKQTKRVRNDDH